MGASVFVPICLVEEGVVVRCSCIIASQIYSCNVFPSILYVVAAASCQNESRILLEPNKSEGHLERAAPSFCFQAVSRAVFRRCLVNSWCVFFDSCQQKKKQITNTMCLFDVMFPTNKTRCGLWFRASLCHRLKWLWISACMKNMFNLSGGESLLHAPLNR